MSLTIKKASLPQALENAVAITVMFSKNEEWVRLRTGCEFKVKTLGGTVIKEKNGTIATDVKEDDRIERGHPLFEQRLKDIRSMMERDIIKEVRKMQGAAIGFYPYKVEVRKEVWHDL